MAKLCKKVIAFEPEPTNYKLLKKNVKNLNVELIKGAVCATEDDQRLWLCGSNSGMHRLYDSSWSTEDSIMVPGYCIDKWFYYEKIDFVKMDIEGSELGALKGMKELLERCHPIMIMEFHPPSIEEYGASPEEEYHFLKTLGYNIRLIPKISITISYEELDKETRKESGRNLLCLPPGRSL